MKDIDKLPKWAQYEITKLERELELANQTINQFHNPQETDIKYQVLLEKPKGLPKHSHVLFLYKNSTVDVSITNEGVRISTQGTIYILPRAANSILVREAE